MQVLLVAAVYPDRMTDFPDWQTFPNAQSNNLFGSTVQTLTPGVHSTAIIPALSWSSLTVLVNATAGACKVTVNHFADAAGVNQLDSDTWPVSTTTNLRVRAPLRGAYVRIDINVTSAGSLTATTWANFLSSSSDRISFPVAAQGVSDFQHSLAANATLLYTAGSICAGQATFYFSPNDATGKLRASIHAADELGNSGALIAYFGLPTTAVQQQISIPDSIVQVEIDNTDTTAAHIYSFSLVIPPQ